MGSIAFLLLHFMWNKASANWEGERGGGHVQPCEHREPPDLGRERARQRVEPDGAAQEANDVQAVRPAAP
eukprot:1183769-Prorocentrum_minimum.AAC.2